MWCLQQPTGEDGNYVSCIPICFTFTSQASPLHLFFSLLLFILVDIHIIRIDQIRAQKTAKRKTKVICTLGPACWSVEGLCGLIDNGMNVARLNFSHGDHETHSATLERLREALASRPGSHVYIPSFDHFHYYLGCCDA